jgi:hypothetical protein
MTEDDTTGQGGTAVPRLRFPRDLSPGPVLDLFLWLHELHRRAGAPDVREMAEVVGCSRHKIHVMLTSGKVPHDGSTLFDLAEWLGKQGSRPQLKGDDESEEAFFTELDTLWAAATRFALLEPELPQPGTSSRKVPLLREEKTNGPGHGEAPESKTEKPFKVGGDQLGGDKIVWSPLSPTSNTPSRPPEMPDLGGSRALLVATGSYDHLPDLPGSVKAAQQLSQTLTTQQPDPAFDRLNALLDPRTSMEVLDAVDDAAAEAEDVLMLYFSGHGLVSRRGELQLATCHTKPDRDHTSLKYNEIREIVSSSRAKRSLIILDACYSGRALDVMGLHSGLQEAPSTYLLASSGATNSSFVDSEGMPVFTRQLLDLLTVGDSGAPEILTVQEIYFALRRRAQAAGYPIPMMRGNEPSCPLALARNPAKQPKQADPA